MFINKKRVSLILVFLIILSSFAVSFNAAEIDGEVNGASGITVHYYSESGAVPNIYYWNALPNNLETNYPGPAMTAKGNNWFSYSFSGTTKINMLFVVGGVQSEELTRTGEGEYWYKNNRWYTKEPVPGPTPTKSDFREDSIYFVITTRFYDGDTGNNVHCWDDGNAGNPDTDPAWRGDFKGLIDRLDYIKALGFSAIWITPVVTNASGYDYHGYHAMDFGTVDARYESQGATYQDLIDAAHEKDMKIIQDMVINHNGNFGESFLMPMFEKEYNTIQDLASPDSMKLIEGSELQKSYPDYYTGSFQNTTLATTQYLKRLYMFKNEDGQNHDKNNYYHHGRDMSWESPLVQTSSIAGDCVDINTENKTVVDYLNSVYSDYINMGIDGFRMDTEKHVSRLTLNQFFFPEWLKAGGEHFFIYGEVCTRVSEFWNHGMPCISAPFYTWKESGSDTLSTNPADWESNVTKTVSHFTANSNTSNQPTSNNAFLDGNNYHTPDYSKSNGTSVIDFPMHWNFGNAGNAYRRCLEEDPYYNDSTWNVTYVDSHDYGPDMDARYNGGTQGWAENWNLLFTFRGIPCVYYGSEMEFMGGVQMDVGPNAPLSTTGRAYFGDYLEGNVTASDFSVYTASGRVADTLNSPLSKHLQKLNMIRRAIPALQKGQYSTQNIQGNGGEMCFKRRYTADGVDSFVCVTITNGATFNSIPNGTYIDAVTGDVQTVSNGTLSVSSPGKGNMRAYVLSSDGFTGISGKIGDTTSMLK